MFKFVVLSVLLAVAQADIDKYLGKGVTIAMSPQFKEYGNGCYWYTISKVSGVHCTCGDRTNVPLISLKYESNIAPDELFATEELKTFAEVNEAVKIKKCKCGDKEYDFFPIKEINDNYHIAYSVPTTPNGPNTAFLNVKTLPTQDDLDEIVRNTPDLSSRTDYGVFCGLH